MDVDEIYIKAFNQAYLLSKYNSDLIDKVLSFKNDGIYFDGLNAGKDAFEQERSLNRIDELNKLKQNKSKNRGLER